MREPAGAAGVVTSCTEASLRAAMAGGGTVTFACDGTIVLDNTIVISGDTALDGGGHHVTISGNNSVRVFQVLPNVAVTLMKLSICSGQTQNGANGPNGTDGSPGEPGGGFYNSGTLTLRDCVVVTNRTGNGGYGTTSGLYGPYTAGGDGGAGGGIFNAGILTLSNCVVAGNTTGNGGAGGGGLTYHPSGGNGGPGGGIYNTGTLHLENTTVCSNGTGNGLDNSLRGPGSNGGTGGGVWSGGSLTANGCTFSGNVTGQGGRGGINETIGGPGGAGGSGAAIYGLGTVALTNCSITGNSTGYGGAGGTGYPPFGQNGVNGPAGAGAGIYSQSNLDLQNCTIAANQVGGGVVLAGNSARLLNTIVALNGGSFGDVSGMFQSLGPNLVGLDPALGPLADNGGPTLTMALLPGSPAIDAGSAVGAPATDQRGVPRPQGASVDIGAFECLVSPIFTGMTVPSATNCQMQLSGLTPNPALTLQVSTNLLNWQDATNFTAGANGSFQCVDPVPGDAQARFYRLKSGTP